MITAFCKRHKLLIDWFLIFAFIGIFDAVASALTGKEQMELIEALVLALGSVALPKLQALTQGDDNG